MDEITIDLSNCFGIKKLNYVFKFANSKAYSIYAPNGTMKTSFAKTIKCISKGEKPKDLINNERISKAIINRKIYKNTCRFRNKENKSFKRNCTIMWNKKYRGNRKRDKYCMGKDRRKHI